MEHGGVEYCFQCSEYPCEKYDHIDDFDSFITHRNRRSDMEKAKRFGIDAYNTVQTEKAKILEIFYPTITMAVKDTLLCSRQSFWSCKNCKRYLKKLTVNLIWKR